MKNKLTKKTQVISGLLALLMLSMVPFSCKKLENPNVDAKALPYGPYVPAALTSSMELNVIKVNPEWQYQLQQSLNADVFSGYMCPPTPFAGNQNNVTYAFVDGWNGFITSIFYDNVMNPWLDIKAVTKAKGVDEDIYSIASILKVIGAVRVAETFGPIPYSKVGTGAIVPWDKQKDLYNAFFDDLKNAIEKLTEVEDQTPAIDLVKWQEFDRSNLGGDYKNWVKLANTVRLRLALHISKADPSKAKSEAEAATSHKYGLLEGMPFTITSTFPHPIGTVGGAWGDILMGAPFVCLLEGYSDLRLPKYAVPAKDSAVAGKYIGIRQGIDISKKSTYGKFSLINITTSAPVQLVSGSESYFLRAEGALNAWNMGGANSAQVFYESGIKASFVGHGLTEANATAYIADVSNNKSAPYVDPYNSANNVLLGSPYLSTIGKQWGGTDAEMREKVITQKWIAMFPDGAEAWSEFRRTGYPKLWPNVVNYSGGSIPAGEFVKRLPYPSSLKSTAPDQYNAALSDLGGPDNGNTKLWIHK